MLGIKGILDLRENNSDLDKIDHLDLCVVNVELNASLFTDNEIVAALKALFYLPKPLLIHCKHGADRTGLIVAIYRICFQNWSKENAINELINGNFNFHVKYVNIIEYINTMDSENIKKQVLAN